MLKKLFYLLSKLISKLSLASYSDKCDDVSLYIFLKVLTSGNNSLLIKRGFPTKEELTEAWESIFSEFTTLSDNKQSNYLLSLLREYYSIPNKIVIIETIVQALSERYDPELIRLLRSMGFRHKYEPETMAMDLQLTVTQSKSLVVRWNDLNTDLEKVGKSEKSEANDYDAILSELSKYQGYRLDPKQITVSEFCAIVKRFKKDNKVKN
jgi:hypothetical protein